MTKGHGGARRRLTRIGCLRQHTVSVIDCPLLPLLTAWKLFNSRLRITNGMTAVRAENPNSDYKAWEWQRDLVLTLGPDGMSSDESDVEGKRLVTVMPWRRREIADSMAIIDQERFNKDGGFSDRGAKPTPRFRGLRNPISNRKPANELPRELYDDDWWKANHRRFALEASEDHFEWKTVTVVSRNR